MNRKLKTHWHKFGYQCSFRLVGFGLELGANFWGPFITNVNMKYEILVLMQSLILQFLMHVFPYCIILCQFAYSGCLINV